MAYLKNLKKIGVNTTVLATSLALVACGGGGGGYYGNNNNSSNNNNGNNTGGNQSETDTTKVAQSLTVTLQDAEGKTLQTAQDNSQVKVAIKVLNADKGGIAGKDIRLSITDADKIGVESTSSKVTSDENGIATFTLDIPALQAATGKVQLTAVVDGTTISIPYTLNIQKASTITSDYNLSVAQGTVLNLPKGSADIAVQVTDTNGGVKPGQTVQLTLPAEMQGKFVIASGSSISTDAEGKATFKITANADLTTAEIAQIVATSQTLTFKLIDEHRAERQATAALTFNDISKTVNVLEVITPDTSIAAKAGTAKIRVFAKNSNGDILANTKVKLAVEAVAASYGVTLDAAEKTTNSSGYAEFTLSSNATQYPLALVQLGINLTATTESSPNIKGNATVQVVTADETVDNQEAIQRLEIASSYKVNAKNDDVTIRVKAINFRGLGATTGKVSIALNAEAQSNGVTLDGAKTQDVDVNGFVTFTLRTNAQTTKAVEALVAAGIKATFTTDNSVSNSIEIAVEDEAVSEEAVRYLAFEPVTQRFDYTKSQVIKVSVQAIGEGDSALKGESISLTRIGLTTQQLQDLGLTPKGSSTKQTDENGFAEFEFQYTFANTQEQKDLVLNPAGIRLLAKSTNDKTQILDLKFKEPSATTDVTLESLVIDTVGLATLAVNTPVTLNVTVKATGSDGQVYKNQKVGLGLNEAALQNGASIVGGASKTTDANGNASFQIQITAKNPTELENLVANGLTLAVKGAETDITVLRKIELSKPAVVLPELVNFSITPVDPTLSVLGGETRVKVVARDIDGNAIPNTPISVALSSLVSGRASLSGVPAMTNSKGEAEFTVIVSEGAYDNQLIKNGITFAVVGTSPRSGDLVQQTSSIGITAPANALNPRLRADVSTVSEGKTVTLYASVKDEMGINTASGTPMRLNLNQAAIDAGVRFSGNVTTTSVVVQGGSDVPVSLVVPVGVSAATLGSIVVTGTIKDPRGNEIPTTLNFTVADTATNPYVLTLNSSKDWLSVDGDKAIITVAATNRVGGSAAANREITLKVKKTNSTTGASVGIVNEEEGDNGIVDTYTVTSDSNGNGFFTLLIPKGVMQDGKDALIASGIELEATLTDDVTGAITSQIIRLNAQSPNTATTPRYSLRMTSSKSALSVRNDITDVTVTLLDQNGGGVADKYVTLYINNFINNGAVIVGASGKTTDDKGQATFSVRVDETVRHQTYSAAQFIADDLNLTASFSTAEVISTPNVTSNVFRIDVIPASVDEQPIGHLTFGRSAVLEKSDDENYYIENMSAQFVDKDGNAIANRSVTMNINLLGILKGMYIPGKDADDKPTRFKTTTASCFGADLPARAQIATAFISPTGSTSNIVTYTTDSSGKFDFRIRYLRQYAGWQALNLAANVTINSTPVQNLESTLYYQLSPRKDDFDSEAGQPFDTSPYGIDTTCN
ncbi:hypothetical protein QTA56_14035 [Acinetobacter sp. VNH17]|uniref:Invasin n=1 Tax=Acinetobacter thutiue TaxID=2998078 RepID=A0ABT7WRN1_9GAMM|nr:hypothetical protein [Acinetobacter thutiue]MCY6413231.1 hypothetical protein [Acinetobacter thutiue]MDN0015340.1 hypothetical protein [Acinetobacter thutiue]